MIKASNTKLPFNFAHVVSRESSYPVTDGNPFSLSLFMEDINAKK